MRLGVLLSLVDGTNRNSICNQARAIESHGYDSIWSAQAMGRGFFMADPFVALSAVAAVTETVEIGTAVLQLPLYNPTDIALKSFALAQLSGERFILGVGAGSTRNDYDIHFAKFTSRFQVFEESLKQLRRIFDTGKTNGIELIPGTVPTVPLYFGTWDKHVPRAARQFDGWIASGMNRSVEQVTTSIKLYRAAGGKRAIVSSLLIPEQRDLGELGERLTRYKEAGFDDAVVLFLPGSPDLEKVRRMLD